jgi:hypothetical protein
MDAFEVTAGGRFPEDEAQLVRQVFRVTSRERCGIRMIPQRLHCFFYIDHVASYALNKRTFSVKKRKRRLNIYYTFQGQLSMGNTENLHVASSLCAKIVKMKVFGNHGMQRMRQKPQAKEA